jgi:hypothetical protein
LATAKTRGSGQPNLRQAPKGKSMAQNRNEIASQWIAYVIRRHPRTGDLKDVPVSDLSGKDDAAQKLLDLVVNDPADAFEVIESILSQTSDPWVLENLGAGPLEELLSSGDEAAVRSMEELSKKYSNTIDALKSMWTQDFPPRARTSVEKILSRK